MLKKIFNRLTARLKKDPLYYTVFFFIFLLAIFFRSYNYHNRIFIEADNTRDLQVAKYAADHLKFPLIGQFSSAGPFFYGPWWYLFLEAISFIPLGIFTHWYILTLISLIYLFLIFKTASLLGGKNLAILALFFTSISPLTISNSLAVWNPTIIPFLVILSLYLLLKYQKNNYPYLGFIIGLVVGLALTIHFQSVLIMPVILAAFIISKPSIKKYLFIILGVLIPFIPLFIFDLKFNWFNFRNIYYYLTVGQYNIWVPNRWLTYIGTYWPDTWSRIIGGGQYLGYLLIAVLAFFTFLNLKRISKLKSLYLIIFVFIAEVILYRYYRGERFVYYSYFAHPSVLLLSAWAIGQLIKKQKIIGLVLLGIIAFFTIRQSIASLAPSPYPYTEIASAKEEIYRQVPSSSYEIYACLFKGMTVSHPMAYFMYLDNKNRTGGIKIEVCENPQKGIDWRVLKEGEVKGGNDDPQNKNTEKVFHETVEWWKEKPPT